MAPDRNQHHLSEISTLWTIVHQAGRQSADDRSAARRLILHRYGGAVQRYLLGALRDSEAAAEVFQEFCLRFMRGQVKGADPRRGRFRDYVKGVLFHMIADYQRQRAKLPKQAPAEIPEPGADDSELARAEREFMTNWRDELLLQCWRELKQVERDSKRPYHAVLKYRSENPGAPSQRIARHLHDKLQQPFTAAGVRQLLHRAREKFSDLLLDIVLQTLDEPSAAQLEEELVDIDLLEYCKPALQRWRERHSP